MSKFAKLAVVAAAAITSLSAQALVIDDFTTPQTQINDRIVDATGSSSSQNLVGGTILGGQRDLFVIETDTPGMDNPGTGVGMDVFGGVLGFANDPGQAGVGIVRWDGTTNTTFGAVGGTAAATLQNAINSIDTGGLGSVNLNASGLGFNIEVVSADAGFNFQLEAYQTGGKKSVFSTASLPGAGMYFIPFFAFVPVSGGGVSFSDVGALQAIINYPGLAKVDVDLRITVAETALPEPASLALVGLALVGAAAATRRRK